MIDALASFFMVLLSASSVLGVSEAGSATMWAVALTAAVVIVLLQAAWSPGSARISLVGQARAIDVSVLLAQSDPDAAGHPRSRAPGFAVSAA